MRAFGVNRTELCCYLLCREGAATLNDMKDMLASLPQYQEQREKVRRQFGYAPSAAVNSV